MGQIERNKDTIQEITETTARHVGNIAQILSDAVIQVAREIGDGVSDAIEMREAAKHAKSAEQPAPEEYPTTDMDR